MAESKDVLTESGRQPTSAERTPGHILEEAWHLTRGGTRAGASKLWHIAREHPLPASVIGLGLGWLLVESSRGKGRSSHVLGGTNPESYNYNTDYLESWESPEGASGRVASAAGAVKDAAVHARDAVKDKALHAKDAISDAAASAGHRVADVAGDVRHRASELGGLTREKAAELKHRTRHQARRAQTGFWQTMEENPLAVGVATLALGVLAGLALPSTRREDELLGETRDKLVDRVEEVGRETLDKGKQVAGTAVDTLKEEAENAGLTASGIAEKVREVGRHTKETVTEEIKAGTAGTTGSRGRTTPRETITPVEQPVLGNKL